MDEIALASDLPSIDKLLHLSAMQPLLATYGRTQVSTTLRKHLDILRRQASEGTLRKNDVLPAQLVISLEKQLTAANRTQLQALFNMTGTVLHTNLGRALLPEAVIQAVVTALRTPSNLEFDLNTGRRGERDNLIEQLLCQLTGAEAATVVNNNAAAVFLLLNTLAQKKEVIVSRGELVEIGGTFRIPDIMQRAGTKLVEVGSTNRTHLTDYLNAITQRSAMLMKVHCSNYVINGFTHSVDIPTLAKLGRPHGLPVCVDLGSGSLVDLAEWGLPKEITVQQTLAQGADIVTFSGDKLLGGPQAGLIVGRAELIARLNKNPLKRALRVGKLTLAALEPVLRLYLAPEFLAERLTTLRLLLRDQASIRMQAERLQPILQSTLQNAYMVSAETMFSQIGSGALPVDHLASYGLAIRANKKRSGHALDKLEKMLRQLTRPVIGRIHQNTLWLDCRCLEEQDEALFSMQLATIKI